MVLVRSNRQNVPARAQLISHREMRLNIAAGPVAEQSDPHQTSASSMHDRWYGPIVP